MKAHLTMIVVVVIGVILAGYVQKQLNKAKA